MIADVEPRDEDEVPAPPRFGPESILYHGHGLLVVNKPAGVPVHRGTGHEQGLAEQINDTKEIVCAKSFCTDKFFLTERLLLIKIIAVPSARCISIVQPFSLTCVERPNTTQGEYSLKAVGYTTYGFLIV